MGSFLEYLSGCGDLSYPFLLPDIPLSIIFVDSMPLIEPLWLFSDYYQKTLAYYQNSLDIVDLVRPYPTVSLDGIDFTEYQFTLDLSYPQDVYALTTGYLFFVAQGQRSYHLDNAIADEDMLILEPLHSSKVMWRWYCE